MFFWNQISPQISISNITNLFCVYGYVYFIFGINSLGDFLVLVSVYLYDINISDIEKILKKMKMIFCLILYKIIYDNLIYVNFYYNYKFDVWFTQPNFTPPPTQYNINICDIQNKTKFLFFFFKLSWNNKVWYNFFL